MNPSQDTPCQATEASSVLQAHTQATALQDALRLRPDALVVACYCAAWCKTCTAYRNDFETLSRHWPDCVFVWIDIEESPAMLGDEDIENFPTLLLQRQGQNLFFGTQQPFIHHLEGLLKRAGQLPTSGIGPGPLATLLEAGD